MFYRKSLNILCNFFLMYGILNIFRNDFLSGYISKCICMIFLYLECFRSEVLYRFSGDLE